MKKILMFILVIGVVSLLLVSCSSDESKGEDASYNFAEEAATEEPLDLYGTDGYALSDEDASKVPYETDLTVTFSSNESSNQVQSESIQENTQRMIIYNADLSIDVEDYLQTQQKIEQILLHMDGYIVNSSVNRHSEQNISAHLDVRIPQAQFTTFLEEVEALSIKVTNRNISGRDVTEEYVDLESRMKSKEIVEERLLGFMESADKTEDLLKISNDLARIQEEIEQIKGRMIYLQNHSALASVSISINEEKIIVPEFNNEDLNVLAKTKEQFVNSLNGLINFFSNLFILLVGNSPVLIILGLMIVAVVFFIRRYRNKKE
ncbi:DUF4349 domain-containing protein [Chengkuizengella marina]|uniref:DUF4349 domain-containing protein n=1 Tax=Chengkuizengella marina TaxID=2507566 RepID=A0A6N9Q169_9BACL|nr:DUF4349 domain-containing protein [Chengkuizengella marina]NBI28986.1 DUF4349 domain-containing protein [Chengkuizengella marina]